MWQRQIRKTSLANNSFYATPATLPLPKEDQFSPLLLSHLAVASCENQPKDQNGVGRGPSNPTRCCPMTASSKSTGKIMGTVSSR